MTSLDPKKRVVREHIRVSSEGGVVVVLRQSKEVGADRWTLERGGGRSPRPPIEARPSLSEGDYAELLLDSERGHSAREMHDDEWQRRQAVLWAEIRLRGYRFATDVWERVREEMSPWAVKIAFAVPKATGDLVKTFSEGGELVYGRVIGSGGRYYTVRWQNGWRSRIEQGDASVEFCLHADIVAEAEGVLG